MLKLLSYPPVFGQPSASPFCVKAMCLLNMAGLEWQPDFNAELDKTPKQKLPVLIDGDKEIPDSDAIRSHIEQKTGIDFDQGLTPEQRAISRAIMRMVEEHLYFALVCDRWLVDANWVHVKEAYFGEIPAPVRDSDSVTEEIREHVRAQVMAQGMARHSVSEQFTRADADIAAIATLLADKPFLFGEMPTAADTITGPMLGAIMSSPTKTLLSACINADQKLVDYVNRCAAKLHPTP